MGPVLINLNSWQIIKVFILKTVLIEEMGHNNRLIINELYKSNRLANKYAFLIKKHVLGNRLLRNTLLWNKLYLTNYWQINSFLI